MLLERFGDVGNNDKDVKVTETDWSRPDYDCFNLISSCLRVRY